MLLPEMLSDPLPDITLLDDRDTKSSSIFLEVKFASEEDLTNESRQCCWAITRFSRL